MSTIGDGLLKSTMRLLSLNALQVYQVIRFTTTLLIGIILAKLFGLDTAEIALYEMILFLGNTVSFFWISAGQKGLLSLFPTYTEKDQGKLLFNFFILLLGLAVIAAAFLYVGQTFLLQRLTQYQEIEFLYLICWYILFNAPAQLIEYVYVLKKQDRQLIQYGWIIHSLQLVGVGIPIWLGWGIQGVFLCLVGWSIVKMCWLLLLLKKYGEAKPDQLILHKILLFMIPLSLHMLLGSGMEYVDGFLVASYFEEKQFAIFRYGARELPFVSLLIGALAATMIPIAVEKETEALHTIKQQIKKLSYWMYPLTIILMLASPYLFPLVYNKDFAASSLIFNIYLLIISSRILLPQVLLYSRQHTHILVYSAILELFLNLGLSLWLLQYYGLAGIAFATVIAYLFNKILLMVYVRKQMNIKVGAYLNWKVYLAFNSLLFLIFWGLMS